MKSFHEDLRVAPDKKISLSDWDPNEMGKWPKMDAAGELEGLRRKMYGLQYKLHAESKRSLLIVLQAMDAGGKDGTIRHVMSGLNPQGCRVASFKVPSSEELAPIFCGGFIGRVRRRARSAFSTGRTMETCWWCGFTTSSRNPFGRNAMSRSIRSRRF